jgi:hypothetical protein
MLVTQAVGLNRMAIGPRLIFQVALHEDTIKKNAEIETEKRSQSEYVEFAPWYEMKFCLTCVSFL